jgi:molybdopterin converting factor small subunit
MRVLIPSALQSYTGANWVDADGATLAEVLADLDRRYPGIRFRMIDERDKARAHIRFFHRKEAVHDLAQALAPGEELLIVQALSGG